MPSNLINKEHLRQVLMSHADNGRDRPQPYHLALLHVAMSFGVNIDATPTQELRPWNVEEAAALLDVIENDGWPDPPIQNCIKGVDYD